MQGLIVSNKLGNSSQELRQIMEALVRFGRTNVGPLTTPLKIGNQFCAKLHNPSVDGRHWICWFCRNSIQQKTRARLALLSKLAKTLKLTETFSWETVSQISVVRFIKVADGNLFISCIEGRESSHKRTGPSGHQRLSSSSSHLLRSHSFEWPGSRRSRRCSCTRKGSRERTDNT